MSTSADLRLSAQRAFLGRIHPEMRLIKIVREEDWIKLTVVIDSDPTERIREDVSEAGTEIVADFPSPNRIDEKIEVSKAPLPHEDIVASGWVYRRAEAEE
jgi:hypothetical protein